ncbi:MAG: hypothetical protein ACRCVU_20250 [Flavobacterium sp.]
MSTYEYLVNLRNEGHAVTAERIVCAANKCADGTIVLGVRHGCEIMLASAKKMGYNNLLRTEQGFYTNWQRFVSREEAMIIAREQGQLFHPEGTHNPDVLYSECLY